MTAAAHRGRTGAKDLRRALAAACTVARASPGGSVTRLVRRVLLAPRWLPLVTYVPPLTLLPYLACR
jgi:hypothetical protein